MILAVHTVAGAFMSQLPLPIAAIFVLSFISHFLIDIIPHGDEQFFDSEWPRDKRLQQAKKIIALDLILTTGLALYFFGTTPEYLHWALFAGIFGNLLPDMLISIHELTPIKTNLLKRFHTFHTNIHDVVKWQPNYSAFFQVITFLILLMSFFRITS
jgi:hypothetical protein